MLAPIDIAVDAAPFSPGASIKLEYIQSTPNTFSPVKFDVLCRILSLIVVPPTPTLPCTNISGYVGDPPPVPPTAVNIKPCDGVFTCSVKLSKLNTS